jgi:uncharacterized SAM-binding protein YcdF (DUF218 family)
MFHIVSKIFAFVLMPAGIILMLLVLAFITKNRNKSRKLLLAALLFFYFISTPFFVDEVARLWEIPPKSIAAVPPHDVGILLTGGVINTAKTPEENIFLGGSADRAAQAIQLYKAGKIKQIIISGGEIPILGQRPTREIDQIARYLVISGVQAKDIFLEDQSTNTRENALNTAAMLGKQFAGKSCLLITSAFHLRRATGCFIKAGVQVTPYGSNYLSGNRSWAIIQFVPDTSPMRTAHLIIREMIGYVSYKLAGWL